VLDRPHRLTSSAGFAAAAGRGRRAGSRTLVVHLADGLADDASTGGPDRAGRAAGPLVGFVVSKAVGNAVVRNRVQRRLRHLVRERLPLLPVTATLVVRALPASAATTYRGLGRDLDTALGRLGVTTRTDGTVTTG
jgi:ribonuclease P protein component